MIKKIAWETFKNTGDINTYLEFKQLEETEKGLKLDFIKTNELELTQKKVESSIDNNYEKFENNL